MKLPPYARTLIERRKQPENERRTHWLLIGTGAWIKARQFNREAVRLFMLCPPSERPNLFDWSIYASAPAPIGLIRCGEVDGQQLQALVQAVLCTGSPRIFDMIADVVYEAETMEKAA